MTREMDVRTETLYILRGGKNIMYYTLLRRASLTLSLSYTTPSPREVLRDGRAARTSNRRFFCLNSQEKSVSNFMQPAKRGCNISVQGAKEMSICEMRGNKIIREFISAIPFYTFLNRKAIFVNY